MEDRDDQTRQLIGSQKKPLPTVSPVWTEENGRVETVSDVTYECSLALVKGVDLTENAMGWSEKKSTNTWLCLWLLLLAIEDKELGSISIDVSKSEHPGTYWRTVEAISRRMLHMETPTDAKRIKSHVKPLYTLNKEHLRDIQTTCEKLKAEEEAKKKRTTKKAKKNEEEEKEDGEEEVAAASGPQPRALNVEQEIAREYVYEDSSADGEIKDVVPIPNGGSEVMSKVTFTVALVQDKDDKTVGYLVRVLVHDKAWNAGEKVQKLIKDCERRDANVANERFDEPYPQYAHLQGTDFPAFCMTWNRWVSCINDSYGERPTYDARVNQMGEKTRADEHSSPMHPKAVCSLRRALKKLKDAGGLIGNQDQYYSSEGTATWPKEMRVVRYLSEQARWDSNKVCGLCHQNFPFSTKMDVYYSQELLQYLKTHQVYYQDALLALTPTFNGYKTGNMLIHMASDADRYWDRACKIRPKNLYESYRMYRDAGVAPSRDVLDYQEAVRAYTAVCMDKFCGMMQLHSAPTYLPIPSSLRSMLKWFQEDTEGFFTTEVRQSDPDLDLFSNYVIRHLGMCENFAKIIRTIIPFKMRGLFSVYMRRDGQILWNMILHGDHGVGKSFITSGFMMKNCIPGTFKVIDRCTNAADQTDQHVDDEIRGQHEMEEAFISDKHGEKHVDKVNMKKASLTSGVVTLKTIEMQTVAGFGKLRAAREVVQAQNYTEVTCSNSSPSENAIGSRYHAVLLGESDVPTEQMNFEVDTEHKKMLQREFREMQFLSCWINKAMSVFAIPCRQPFMTLFNDISNRMLETGRAWGVISDRASVRALEIMAPMAWELTVEKAATLTFFTPGGAHYGSKRFEPQQLRDVAPLLYCDTNITLLTWTLHSSDWIKSDFSNVLKAMWLVATSNREWDSTMSMYQYYEQDTAGTIRFKTDKNFGYSKEDHGNLNKHVVDLNYVELACTKHEELFQQIADRTKPRLSPSDVKGVIELLSSRSFRPRHGAKSRNGYTRSVLSDDLKQHRGVQTVKLQLNPSSYKQMLKSLCTEMHETLFRELVPPDVETFKDARGMVLGEPCGIVSGYLKGRTEPVSYEQIKHIVSSFTGVNIAHLGPNDDPMALVPHFTLDDAYLIRHFSYAIRLRGDPSHTYIKKNIIRDPLQVAFPKYASEDDINMLNNIPVSQIDHIEKLSMISIVDMTVRKRICFSPVAIELFDKEIILDMFMEATLCSSMREGKRLLGWVDERDISKLRTIKLTREQIDQRVKAFDDNLPPGAVLRQTGVAFKRRKHVERSMNSVLFGEEAAAPAAAAAAAAPNEVIADLDLWAAEQQHVLCGMPFSDPVKDPQRAFKQAGGITGNVDYPDEIIRDKLRTSKTHWEPNAATASSRKLVKF